jgi:hypothetical protein
MHVGLDQTGGDRGLRRTGVRVEIEDQIARTDIHDWNKNGVFDALAVADEFLAVLLKLPIPPRDKIRERGIAPTLVSGKG